MQARASARAPSRPAPGRQQPARRHRRAAAVLRAIAVAAGLVVVAACGGAAAPGSGEVVLLVTDHREAIGDFSSAVAAIEAVELHRRGSLPDAGWVRLAGVAGSVDLTQYPDSNVELGRTAVPARRYDALRLVAGSIDGTLAVAGAEGTRVEVPFAPPPAAIELRVVAGETVHVLVDITINDVRDHPGETYRGVIFSAGPVAADTL